ncbi:MAG: hypothetical protein ACO3VB_00900 [Opitutales bacterium]
MSLVLEFLNEHALSIDFAMFVLIGLVQVIVYPVFREIPHNRFAVWHPRYCNQIGGFVLPLMFAQLIGSLSACFFIGEALSWAHLLFVGVAWLVTFLVSAPCHRRLMKDGKEDSVVERLIRTNYWRVLAWSGALVCSWIQY